jgi:hypothetical protein
VLREPHVPVRNSQTDFDLAKGFRRDPRRLHDLFRRRLRVAYFTGGLTPDGFKLNGAPAFILFAIVIAYFVIGRKFAGGTLWQRILHA